MFFEHTSSFFHLRVKTNLRSAVGTCSFVAVINYQQTGHKLWLVPSLEGLHSDRVTWLPGGAIVLVIVVRTV